MPRADMDHRWGARTPVHLDVRLVCKPAAIAPGWLSDVSISGAYVRTELMMQLLSPVRIVVVDRLPSGRRSMDLAAFVVRRDSGGLGLEWRNLAPKSLRRLHSVFAPLDIDAALWPCHIFPDLAQRTLKQ